jgi:Protein of unknown function (DUF3179)
VDNIATETTNKKQLKNRRRGAWIALLIITLTALSVVIIPVGLIMPFRSQSQGGLALAYTLRRWSPLLTLVAALAAIALVVWLWRATRWWRKPALVIALILTFTATWFARQNHFEWMFNPLPNAAYAKISDAGFMSDPDMVLAVENQGEAVAYPIRLMAYHHVVQDTVGGTPLVATY